jgi:hypothetical protein
MAMYDSAQEVDSQIMHRHSGLLVKAGLRPGRHISFLSWFVHVDQIRVTYKMRQYNISKHALVDQFVINCSSSSMNFAFRLHLRLAWGAVISFDMYVSFAKKVALVDGIY